MVLEAAGSSPVAHPTSFVDAIALTPSIFGRFPPETYADPVQIWTFKAGLGRFGVLDDPLDDLKGGGGANGRSPMQEPHFSSGVYTIAFADN